MSAHSPDTTTSIASPTSTTEGLGDPEQATAWSWASSFLREREKWSFPEAGTPVGRGYAICQPQAALGVLWSGRLQDPEGPLFSLSMSGSRPFLAHQWHFR